MTYIEPGYDEADVRRAMLEDWEDGTFEICGLCRGTGNIGSHLCPDCAGRCIVPHECRTEARVDAVWGFSWQRGRDRELE